MDPPVPANCHCADTVNRALSQFYLDGILSTEKHRDDECAICKEIYSENGRRPEVPLQLPCGHVFGDECIKLWFLSRKNTCPLCRAVAFDRRLCFICAREWRERVFGIESAQGLGWDEDGEEDEEEDEEEGAGEEVEEEDEEEGQGAGEEEQGEDGEERAGNGEEQEDGGEHGEEAEEEEEDDGEVRPPDLSHLVLLHLAFQLVVSEIVRSFRA